MSLTDIQSPFFEQSAKKNIRYICYSLLSKVTFEGEHVVPLIVSEKDHVEYLGKVFEVERLEGEDLYEYLVDLNHSKEEKLHVLLHIVRQLKAIDKAGFVIFDRNGGNIRVLSSDPKHISTRQIDIEDMYDKLGDCVYTLREASMSDELIDQLKENNVHLWAIAVNKLSVQGELIGETHHDQTIVDIFSLCRWEKGEKGHDLEDLEKACLHAIELS